MEDELETNACGDSFTVVKLLPANVLEYHRYNHDLIHITIFKCIAYSKMIYFDHFIEAIFTFDLRDQYS